MNKTTISIEITVNGNTLTVEYGSSVEECIKMYSSIEAAHAVFVNNHLIPKEYCALRKVGDGDILRVIYFLGGG